MDAARYFGLNHSTRDAPAGALLEASLATAMNHNRGVAHHC